ncbi:MAG: putative lipoic acid-binding regulatory protein [Polaribacter sp.]|jgi:putative lipoic acid-binding regulatory protein
MSKDEITEEEAVAQLWNFPCEFMFKAMAFANQGADNEIISVINQFVPGDYVAKLNPSKKGTYVAVSVNFLAQSKKQLDEIYIAVNRLECVKVCL